jgi:hypothetical protein
MTPLPYSPTDREVDLVDEWLRARAAEKPKARTYYGGRPCLPTDAIMQVCRNIFTKRKP